MKDKIINRLEELIEELDDVQDADDFVDWQEVALNSMENIFRSENILRSIGEIDAEDEHEEDISDLAVISAKKILYGLIKDAESGFGIKLPGKARKATPPIQVNNHLIQHSQQSIQIDIEQKVKQQVEFKLKFIVDAFKEELTGKQLRELKEIQDSADPAEVKKVRFFDKLKLFGGDVAAGMVSSILANPDFIQQLTH